MRLFLASSIAILLAGCSRATGAASTDAGTTHTTAAIVEADAGFTSAAAELAAPVVDAGGVRPLGAPPKAGERLDIPAGTFALGSTPGDEGRAPSIEPALVDTKLGAFAIDALPYPNDPARAPELVSSQGDAERLCAERGERLCTEVEWERACKGPEGARYATGATWDPGCEKTPSRCSSGFGPRAMGFLREWTDDKASFGSREGAVIRGGPGVARRCAARATSVTKGMPGQMAFRCCHGDRNTATVPEIEAKPAFRRTEMEPGELARIFAELPELKRISEGVKFYDDSDVKAVVARAGGKDDTNRAEGISFATAPILWSPELGVELLVASGRSKKTGFVVALWPLPQGKYRFASSFLFLDDPSPVVLAWEPSHRRELRWTTCWGCAGEQGAVSLRDDGRAVIVQF